MVTTATITPGMPTLRLSALLVFARPVPTVLVQIASFFNVDENDATDQLAADVLTDAVVTDGEVYLPKSTSLHCGRAFALFVSGS